MIAAESVTSSADSSAGKGGEQMMLRGSSISKEALVDLVLVRCSGDLQTTVTFDIPDCLLSNSVAFGYGCTHQAIGAAGSV
jgi:hypothetical protein